MSICIKGLTEEAEKFLRDNCFSVKSIEPHDNKVNEERKYVLRQYQLKDGTIVNEVIQAVAGPFSFCCLELEDGTQIGKWPEEDMKLSNFGFYHND